MITEFQRETDHLMLLANVEAEPDEIGEYPCWKCGTPGVDCLNELNSRGTRCCGVCHLGAHQKQALSGDAEEATEDG